MFINILAIILKCNLIKEGKESRKLYIKENEYRKLLVNIKKKENELVKIFVKNKCTKSFSISFHKFDDGPGYEIICHFNTFVKLSTFLKVFKKKVRNKLKEFIRTITVDSKVSYQVTLETVESGEKLLPKAVSFFW